MANRLPQLVDRKGELRGVAWFYQERWEAESVFLGLKVTQRGAGRVLRSGSLSDVDQKLYRRRIRSRTPEPA